MKKLLVLAALVVLAVPAAYAASASKEKPSTSAAQSQSSEENAAKACKAERTSLGVAAFNKKYGTNHNLRNAFGKCVSGKSKANDEKGNNPKGKDEDEQGENEKDTSSAAKQCEKERADMGAQSFANKYGTNHNKANPLGKCVSSKAKEQSESDDD